MNVQAVKRRDRQALTLIEVLLVLVILVILGSLVGLAARQQMKKALVDAAKAQMAGFSQSLDLYEMDIRNYPTTNQGLQALVEAPSDLNNPDRWRPGYLKSKQVPLDPWDNPYQYQLVDADNYRIWSWGPDGVDGTADDITRP